NCETDALVPARAARKNGGVNADKIAVQIDHRAARVARIDCGVRLNEIFKPLDLSIHSAARCTHDSHRGRFADSKWIADCEHNVAYLQFRRIANRQSGQAGGIDLEDCNIRLRIGSHELSGEIALVRQLDFDFSRAVDYVIVRHDGSVRSDDHARTEALLSLWLRLDSSTLIAEELPKERVIEEGHRLAGFRLHNLRGVDVHDRGKSRLQHRGEAVCKCAERHRRAVARNCHRKARGTVNGTTRPISKPGCEYRATG